MSGLKSSRTRPAVGHLQRLAGVLVVLVILCGVGVAAPPPVLRTFHGTSSGDGFGSAVAFGDVNGDGTLDVIIGAAKNGNPALGPGYVKVFDGANLGRVLYTFNGTQAGSWFGDHAVAAGDVNGDGKADIIIGEYGFDVMGARTVKRDVGRVFVYSGATGQLLYTLNGVQASDNFGASVAVKEANGAEPAAVLVGAPFSNVYHQSAGYVKLFNGPNGALLHTFPGLQAWDEMGRSVSFGDLNGDDILDCFLGAGSGTFPSWGGYVQVMNGETFLQLQLWDAGLTRSQKPKPEPNLGFAHDPGDVIGDGIADLSVGAYRGKTPDMITGTATGYVRVFNGATGAMRYQFNGTTNGDEFGRSITTGDVNEDGEADIIVGAHFGTVTDANGPTGYIRVFDGATGDLLYQLSATAHGELLGEAVAAADMDLDGTADVAVGSPGGSSNGLTGNGFVQLLGD
jgi:FG-GAP repeat protein